MHVELHPGRADSTAARRAQELTRACVHCGFCLTTCPTYIDTRDERDSPRGRIYLIKHLLEGTDASAQTRTHLDRCLTCRNCETACPSGMLYGELLEIGRELIEQEAPRTIFDRSLRRAIRFLFARPALMRPLLRLGQYLRPILGAQLGRRIPLRQPALALPDRQHARRMLVLEGCVQSAATPNTNGAARRVLDRLGITLVSAPGAGCCGALDHHLSAHAQALAQMRRNIDAWWPQVEQGVEAVISSASGCGAMLVDYGRLLANDPAYSARARRISALARDLGDILLEEDLAPLGIKPDRGPVAVHTPCSMAHALQRPTLLVDILQRAGFTLVQPAQQLLCCGSAGTYSLLQPASSERVLQRTLDALTAGHPAVIATANIGCQLHLQSATDTPVVHWIELLDQA